VGQLRDRRIVVIGATGGIGTSIVDRLLSEDVKVFAAGRDPHRLDLLRARGVTTCPIDLASRASSQKLAREAQQKLGALDGLVVATGSVEPVGPTRQVDLNRLEAAFREHAIGAIALVQDCADLLDAGDSASVVLFSGGGATTALPRYTAYALAKVAIVRFVENLALEEPDWKVNAVAPGFVATRIHEPTLSAGPEIAGPYFWETERRLREPELPTAASDLVAFLLSPESEGISGRLISAVWDPWQEEESRKLLSSDPSFARLRRIDRQRFFEIPDAEGLD
jgi:NAD(P)-dependent dehydrogenase (short-subunit alcohol dehydrogenase family)